MFAFVRSVNAFTLVALLLLGTSGCASWPWRPGPVPESVATCRELSQQAMAASENGDQQRAEELFARAIESCPMDADSRRYYADVLLKRGATNEALAQLEHARRLTGGDPLLTVRTGEIYLSRQELQLAEARARRALKMDPKLPEAWALRGRIHRVRGDHRAALTDLQRALGYQPDDTVLMREVTELYLTLQRPARALIHLQRLAEIHAGGEVPSELLELQAQAYLGLSRYREAAACYQMACRQQSTSADLYFRLADAELRAGEPDRARAAARRALEILPEHAPSQQLLASFAAPPVQASFQP